MLVHWLQNCIKKKGNMASQPFNADDGITKADPA